MEQHMTSVGKITAEDIRKVQEKIMARILLREDCAPHNHADVEYHNGCPGCKDPRGGIWEYGADYSQGTDYSRSAVVDLEPDEYHYSDQKELPSG